MGPNVNLEPQAVRTDFVFACWLVDGTFSGTIWFFEFIFFDFYVLKVDFMFPVLRIMCLFPVKRT